MSWQANNDEITFVPYEEIGIIYQNNPIMVMIYLEEGLKKLLNIRSKFRQMRFNYIPNTLKVDTHIMVDKNITESCHITPWKIMIFFIKFRNVAWQVAPAVGDDAESAAPAA